MIAALIERCRRGWRSMACAASNAVLRVNSFILIAHLASHPEARVVVLNGLNHLLQPAGTGAPREYADIDTTIDPGVLTLLTSWLGQHL